MQRCTPASSFPLASAFAYACTASLIWLAAAGPSLAAGIEGVAARFADRKAFDRFVAEGRDSPFGLDYVFVHSPGARDAKLVDRVCGEVGFRWVNLSRLEWKLVEPKAPRDGQHTYHWSDLDAAVRTWQRNGVHIMLSLRFESPWATAPKSDSEFVYLRGLAKQVALLGADYLPKPEHLPHLREYARRLVERYDGDGIDDMPGLQFPVLHYQVGNEYYNEVFWTGTANEYGQLLHHFVAGARAACPDVRIVLSGIGLENVYGFYDAGMDPRTEAFVRSRLPKVPPNMQTFLKRSEAFSRATVGFSNDYDILDARWPNFGIVAKSRELLKELGCPDKPVWSAEIYSGFPLSEALVLPNWTLHAWPTPSRSLEYLRVLTNRNHADFETVNRWYRGLQAAQVVKICMVALHAGSEKLMMGWAIDIQNPLAVSTLSHHGLYSATFEHLWPAAYTYDLTIRKLNGVQRVERLRAADSVFVYRADLGQDRFVLIAFCDDHIGQNHDEPTAVTQGTIPWRTRRARVTQAITEIGVTEAKTEQVEARGGMLRLQLTEYPVFIEPVDER
ncbi:MAG: hypothetical protein KJ000_29985 [Pirellulaceae bacterium]|nr:hypothetical protein [Pirellulaceae bacterium]